ncbi:hypothetical protein [Gracilinema caldarium]|uniref:Uncharacterized protein n=1 Tax=Gracilinema caldarium (strain ATCC 51460 / DSM 7334 / H1) TaxID=744872 RepID=F8EZM1_GRAC1|nr:hypothetical protein [Gracilinema caldarium]AEJ20745.1 hypothetical protein Spica_2647 [Gracilinema caldarium DSM 7334]
MNTTSIRTTFSFRRLYYLVRNRILDDSASVLIVAGAFLALNLLLLFFTDNYNPGSTESWGMLIAGGGMLLAGIAFSKMHDGKAGTEWILLPASSAEKYIAALVTYLVVYPVIASLLVVLETLLISGVATLMRTGRFWVYNPVAPVIIRYYFDYAFLVLLSLAGSARFRKFAIGKTAAITFGFILLASFLLLLGILLKDPWVQTALFQPNAAQSVIVHKELDLSEYESRNQSFWYLVRVFQIGTALFTMGYGYALVREKEARDEVQ